MEKVDKIMRNNSRIPLTKRAKHITQNKPRIPLTERAKHRKEIRSSLAKVAWMDEFKKRILAEEDLTYRKISDMLGLCIVKHSLPKFNNNISKMSREMKMDRATIQTKLDRLRYLQREGKF